MSDKEATYDLPDEIVQQLLCSLCNGYVSCGPVKIRPDGGTICGRCSASSGEECLRNTIFEVAMSKFRFPCQYKAQGCQKRLLFGAVEHEDMCPYRTFPCPSFASCYQNVSAFDVHKHFRENHDNLIIKEGKFKLDLDHDSHSNLLMIENEIVVTVQHNYDSLKKLLCVDVGYFSDNRQGVCYKLQIISGLDSDRIINFKENACRQYELHMMNKENACQFIMSNYLPALDNPDHVYIKIKLSNCKAALKAKTKPEVEDRLLVSVEEKTKKAWNLLENFRCNLCHSIGFPPFYRAFDAYYGTGYTCCDDCKTTKSNSHKFVEKDAKAFNFPCRWRGCTFMGNKDNIRKHVEDCEFRTYMCPFSCSKGFYTSNNLVDHMRNHGTYCQDPGKIFIELDETKSRSATYFTIFEGTIVSVRCYTSTVIGNDWNFAMGKNKFAFDLHFEHDHCLFRSVTYFNVKCFENYSTYESKFPGCFKQCKPIRAVLKIRSLA